MNISHDISTIMLEPRLMEFIKKKKHYIDNKIEPVVPLEQQYSITPNDKKVLISYMKGDTKTYERRAKTQHVDTVDPRGQQFKSSEYEDDPRFDRLRKKMEKDKMAQESRNNYGIIKQKYDMYDESRDYASTMGDDRDHMFARKRSSDFKPNKPSFKDFLLDSGEDVDNDKLLKHPKRKNLYSNPPKIKYNSRLYPGERLDDDKIDFSDLIGKMDTYKHNSEKYHSFSSDMDLDTKTVIPYMNCKKDIGENTYNSMPFMSGGSKSRNIDADTYVRFGINSRGSKSLGYNNVSDHAFQFISPDIQDPDHVVMERGVPTRSFNKTMAKPKKRSFM